jgi:glucuronosyltransferase
MNIEKLARLIDDVPMKSHEKALWHIEYVIRNNGAKHLHYPQKEIPFYQYHYCDILLSLISILVVITLLIILLFMITSKCIKKALNWKLKKD